MNTNKQALTIEECKELKALGFDMSDASMIYVQDPFFGGMDLQVNHGQYEPGDCYTYTLQDILEKLPSKFKWKTEYYWFRVYINGFGNKVLGYVDSEDWAIQHVHFTVHGVFNMLKWCKENNLI